MEASYKPYPINRIPQPGLDIFYAMLAEKKFTADDVKAKVTAAGYSKVHDVDYDDGVWKADAERDDGKNIEVRVDAKDGRILAVDND